MERKKKLVIDIDTGSDDAQALMMTLALNNTVDVIAITCVGGNTSLDNVLVNTLRVLQACDRLDIPVYSGAAKSLLGERARDATKVHGVDGLGDITCTEPAPPITHIQRKHAAVAICNLVADHPGEVTLVALGPLTNVALALKLAPELGQNLCELVVMGGNIAARERVEFNFTSDPEAAFIVITQMNLHEDKFFIVPFETCAKSTLDWEWTDRWMVKDTPLGRFHSRINAVNVVFRHASDALNPPGAYFTCDPIAVLVAAFASRSGMEKSGTVSNLAIVGSVIWNASVELHAAGARGQILNVTDGSVSGKVTIVTEINMELYKRCLEKMVE